MREKIFKIFMHSCSYPCKTFISVHFYLLANQQYIVELQNFPLECKTGAIHKTFLHLSFSLYSIV